MDLFQSISTKIYNAKTPENDGVFGRDPQTLRVALLEMRRLANARANCVLSTAQELLNEYISDSRRFDIHDTKALVDLVNHWGPYGGSLDGVKKVKRA